MPGCKGGVFLNAMFQRQCFVQYTNLKCDVLKLCYQCDVFKIFNAMFCTRGFKCDVLCEIIENTMFSKSFQSPFKYFCYFNKNTTT
jgi:hypothetical protein